MNRQSPEPNNLQGLGKGMTYAAWIVVLGLLTLLFNEFLEEQANPNRQVQSAVSDQGMVEVRLQRNRAGHYVANGGINGRQVVFLVDTGATDVAVPGRVARRLGLEQGRPVASRTANGVAEAYATRLDSVELGKIRLRDVQATILPGMDGAEVLLGMSFLKRLELIQRGDQLTLRAYPG